MTDSKAGTVLVTGAGGFIGGHVVSHLRGSGFEVRALLHKSAIPAGAGELAVDIGDPGGLPPECFNGVAAVIHLAALAHETWPENAYLRVNTAATARLAADAAQAGVQRLLFLSTAGVHGSHSPVTAGFTHRFIESDTPAPWNAYTRSKLEAELGLRGAGAGSGMHCIVLRLPIVHGAGVRASFLRLLHAIARGVPLPLQGVRARRSLMYVGNLVQLIERILRSPPTTGTFLASDWDAGIVELAEVLGEGLGRRARLWSCPPPLLAAATRLPLIGRSLERLTGSFLLDNALLRSTFSWLPPVSLREGLLATATAYAGGRRSRP